MSVIYKGRHHRNPSGCNNKAKWILSVSKWNKTRAIKLVEHITSGMPRSKQRSSWYTALGRALQMYETSRRADFALVENLASFLIRHKNRPPYIGEAIADVISYIQEDLQWH